MPKLSTYWLLFYIFAYYSRKIQLISFIIWQPFKHHFLHSARCRPQKQDLFSGFRSVQTSKTKLVFWTSQRAEFKIRVCFRGLHAAECKNRTCFWGLHTAWRKNKVCFLDSARCGVAIQNLFSTLCTLRNTKSAFVFASCSAMNHSYLGNFTILLSVR